MNLQHSAALTKPDPVYEAAACARMHSEGEASTQRARSWTELDLETHCRWQAIAGRGALQFPLLMLAADWPSRGAVVPSVHTREARSRWGAVLWQGAAVSACGEL